jgi:hypothetical protein
MKFLRSAKGYTRMDHIGNEEIITELEMYAIQDKITEYRICWSAHLQRMDNSRLPKHALLYKPRGRRDGQLMSEQETLLYLEVMMMMMINLGVMLNKMVSTASKKKFWRGFIQEYCSLPELWKGKSEADRNRNLKTAGCDKLVGK